MLKPANKLRLKGNGKASQPWYEEVQGMLALGETLRAGFFLRERIGKDPKEARAHYWLGIIALMENRLPDAEAALTAALQLEADDATFWFALGRVHKAKQCQDLAVDCYRKATTLDPHYLDAYVSLAISMRSLGRVRDAVEQLEAALALDSSHDVACLNLVNLLEQLPRAEPADKQSTASDFERTAQGFHARGVQHALVAQWVEAAEWFNQALGIDSRRLSSCLWMGAMLGHAYGPVAQRVFYKKWLAANAPNAIVLALLGRAQRDEGDLSASEASCRQALALSPGFGMASMILGEVAQKLMDVEGAILAYQQACGAHNFYSAAHQALLFTRNYLDEDPAAVLALHSRFSSGLLPAKLAWTLPTASANAESASAQKRRIRLAYLSPDFRRHSVAYFIEAMLQAHDKKRFEILCYSNGDVADEVTQRLKLHADVWIDCSCMTDDALHDRIVQDCVDVMVDLAGLTSGNRVNVLGRHPVAIQINYLGYPTTTGAEAFDYRVTDARIDPPGYDRYSSERLLRMPVSMFCYLPDVAPELQPPPCMRAGTITFGSFNNLAKLSPHAVALWARVLHRVPDSSLLLKAAGTAQQVSQRRICEAFSAHGIAEHRIRFMSWSREPDAHLMAYQEVDIGLDTYPYNGATTTCEALWMGVPVISRCGATHPSRMGASILAAIGHEDWVAESDDEFVSMAAALAAQPGAIAMFRREARKLLGASPLLDGVAQARDFESLLEHALMDRGS
jgi:predicted O-linked N-acetylglucosamine transferase (SPINDLY family)